MVWDQSPFTQSCSESFRWLSQHPHHGLVTSAFILVGLVSTAVGDPLSGQDIRLGHLYLTSNALGKVLTGKGPQGAPSLLPTSDLVIYPWVWLFISVPGPCLCCALHQSHAVSLALPPQTLCILPGAPPYPTTDALNTPPTLPPLHCPASDCLWEPLQGNYILSSDCSHLSFVLPTEADYCTCTSPFDSSCPAFSVAGMRAPKKPHSCWAGSSSPAGSLAWVAQNYTSWWFVTSCESDHWSCTILIWGKLERAYYPHITEEEGEVQRDSWFTLTSCHQARDPSTVRSLHCSHCSSTHGTS